MLEQLTPQGYYDFAGDQDSAILTRIFTRAPPTIAMILLRFIGQLYQQTAQCAPEWLRMQETKACD
jgi:hypothetical protein